MNTEEIVKMKISPIYFSKYLSLLGNFYNFETREFNTDLESEELADRISYENLPEWATKLLTDEGLESRNYLSKGLKEEADKLEAFSDFLDALVSNLQIEETLEESLAGYPGFRQKEDIFTYKLGIKVGEKEELVTIECASRNFGEFFENIATLIAIQSETYSMTPILERIELSSDVFIITVSYDHF